MSERREYRGDGRLADAGRPEGARRLAKRRGLIPLRDDARAAVNDVGPGSNPPFFERASSRRTCWLA